MKVHKHEILIENMVRKIILDPTYKGAPAVTKILKSLPQELTEDKNDILQCLLSDLDKNKKVADAALNSGSRNNLSSTKSNNRINSNIVIPAATSSPKGTQSVLLPNSISNKTMKVNSSPSSPVLKTSSPRPARGGTKSSSSSPTSRRTDVSLKLKESEISHYSSNSNSPSRANTSSPSFVGKKSQTNATDCPQIVTSDQTNSVLLLTQQTLPPHLQKSISVSKVVNNVPVHSNVNSVNIEPTSDRSQVKVLDGRRKTLNHTRKSKQPISENVSNSPFVSSVSTSDITITNNTTNKYCSIRQNGNVTNENPRKTSHERLQNNQTVQISSTNTAVAN